MINPAHDQENAARTRTGKETVRQRERAACDGTRNKPRRL
jgi:hypothetical protein